MKKEIEATIKKVENLGFLRKLKNVEDSYEIKSSIKSFIDISFLEEFDNKLGEYKKAKLWS
jgi:hypothetical protein